ncbi:phage tail protein [Dactylosporangium sp. NPDC051541]|uniref:phage tail protein n=1 Tax=Dactylosporangium sp. NPDC051541 TaxID=3363977 RepID=UPI0037943E0B
MSAGALPVGTVLAFAGPVPGDLRPGWLPCDGATYPGADCPELYAAIGFAFGKTGTDPVVFSVPDLRGLFVRCTPDAAVRDARDPEWRLRTALLPGGHSREWVGSYQVYGTAPARNGFKSSVNNASIGTIRDDAGCGPIVAAKPNRAEDVRLHGGDRESRPANKNVHFVIKAQPQAEVPIGAVLTMAASRAAHDGSYPCDGTPREPRGPAKRLYDTIGTSHGRTDDGDFLLPDYRGWFLRGVSGLARRDPDGDAREPAEAGGNAGNQVGSAQPWATGLPTSRERPATVRFENLPDGDRGKSIAGAIRTAVVRNAGGQTVTFGLSQGDRETRPANASVDFRVVFRPQIVSAPVGTIITVGGPVPADSGWLPCDGRILPAADHQDLRDALGGQWGGDGTSTVALPDLRGRFLRGADHGTGTDPDAGSRTPQGTGGARDPGSIQDYATGAPRTPFTAAVPYLPTDSTQISGETRGDVAGRDGARTVDVFNGGNADSRPANLYLDAYIRVR